MLMLLLPGTRLRATMLAASFLFAGCGGSKTEGSEALDTPFEPEILSVKIDHCHDGDTCKGKIEGSGESISIRMVGIDCPEVSGRDGSPGQALGAEAGEYLNGLIEGKLVKVARITTDLYGRTVGEIRHGTRNINLQMVKQGFAETYMLTPRIDRAKYQAAEQDAKDAHIGIWDIPNRESPADFRRRTDNRN